MFSYACPACNAFNPIAHKLIASLPPNAVFSYVHASFNPGEDWPMFQRAFCTAEALGIAARTHDAMFDAVWKSNELAVMNSSGQIVSKLPTIEDAARWYAKHAGVKAEDFLAASKSFDVDRRVRQANQYIKDFQVTGTPTIVVNMKYRTTAQLAGGYGQLVDLVDYLVAKESKK